MLHKAYSILLLIISTNVFAGNNIWTSHGPFRSFFTHIEFSRNNPNIVFAYRNDRQSNVLRSTDSGLTWQHLRFPGNLGYPTTLRIHPKNSNIVFGVADSVFISRNRGTTWQEISHRPFGDVLFDLEFDPVDPNIIYGVTLGYHGKQPSPSEVFKSIDGGRSWSTIFSNICCNTNVPNIEIDPSNGKRIYLAFNNVFFRTTDGGKKWQRLKTGKPNLFVSLKIDLSNGKQLYAAGYQGIYKTTDGGNTWFFTGTKCGPHISIDSKNPKIIYSVGELGNRPCATKSQDGGASWQQLSFPHTTPTDNFSAVAVNPGKPNVLLVSSDLLYRSVNAGRSWITITNGKGNLHASVAVNSKPIQDVYAFDYNRLFASFANRKWRLLRTPSAFGINRLLVSAQDPTKLIAGGSHIPFTSTPDEALIVSFDSGMTWQYRTGPFSWVQDLIMDPLDSNKIYAAGSIRSNVAIGRSSDFGKTWETVVTNAPSSYANIRTDPLNSSVLYASSAYGLLRSTNSGKSWSSYGNTPSEKYIRSMDIAPRHIYLLMEDALAESNTNLIYRSDDGGLNFQVKNEGLPTNNLYFLKVHPTDASTVFVGTDRGLFVSNNHGDTWILLETAGLPKDHGIFNLAIPLSNPKKYFVGASLGVFSFTNE